MRGLRPRFTPLVRASIPAPSFSLLQHPRLYRPSSPAPSIEGEEEVKERSHRSLPDILQTAARRSAETKLGSSRQAHERRHGQDDEWCKQLRLLFENADVSSAMSMCSKLPPDCAEKGFDMLIDVLIERGGECGADIVHQDALADKTFDILQQMKAKRLAPSEITSKKLLKWLFDMGDMTRFRKALCWEEQQEILGVHVIKDVPSEGISPEEEAKYQNLVGNYLKMISDGVEISKCSCMDRLKNMFWRLGALGYLKKSEEFFLQLQSEGSLAEDLLELIDSFTKGLTNIHQRRRNIKMDVASFKNIIGFLKLSTTASFDTLIGHCVTHGEKEMMKDNQDVSDTFKIDLCVDLIQAMEKHGQKPSAITFEPLITFFARILDMSKAEDILQAMRINSIEPTLKSYKLMIVAYSKSDDIEKAYNLIEGISFQKLTADLYTPIIHAYGIKGQLRQALGVFKQMKLKELNPIADNFANLILAFAFRRDIKNAELAFKLAQKHKYFTSEDWDVLKAAMIRSYGICNNSQKLEKMTDGNVAGLLDVKSALLSRYANSGNIDEAIKMYEEIRWINSWPDVGTFFSFLTALGNAGDIEKLFSTFGSFKESIRNKSRVIQEELTCLACCHVFYPLIHNNRLEKALDFLEHIQRESLGDVETLCSLVFTIDGKSAAHRIELTLDEKLKFMEAMIERLKIQPTRILYEYMLESCTRAKDIQRADHILQLMRAQNLELNIFTFLIYLRIVGSRGDYARVQNVLMEMKRMDDHGLRDHDVKEIITRTLEEAEMADKLMRILYPEHCHSKHKSK